MLKRSEARLGALLWAGCTVGTLAILPFVLKLRGSAVPLTLSLFARAAVNSLILYPLPIYLGMLAKRRALVAGAPFLEHGRRLARRDLLLQGVGVGIVLSIAITGLEAIFEWIGPRMTEAAAAHAPGPGLGLLASLYGGIVEETLFRFCLMGLIAAALRPLGRAGVWAAILLAAFGFGAGHLPAVATVLGVPGIAQVPLVIIARILLLNSLAGITCGYLYWRRGFEFAMLAHATTDVVLHGLLALR